MKSRCSIGHGAVDMFLTKIGGNRNPLMLEMRGGRTDSRALVHTQSVEDEGDKEESLQEV